MKIFGGLEGGATLSKVVLLDENGRILAQISDGPPTNHWMIGFDECHRRIHSMIESAKQLAGIESNIPLDTLGLSMSGCEDNETNEKFRNQLTTRFPNLTKYCFVSSDTLGSLITCSPLGGIVLIAGTGSNCLLFNPDETNYKCGGWGHILGDYNSAVWITTKAIKLVIESEENFTPIPFDITRVRQLICEYFNVNDMFGLLKPVYSTFDKTFYAGLCRQLAQIALEENDLLSIEIFRLAAVDMAKHINALLPKIDPSLLQSSRGLVVVCVGSLFKSWKLFEKGFFSKLDKSLTEVTLVRSTQSSALGAAYIASKRAKHRLDLDFEKNSEVLCHFKNGKFVSF